jgi:hypothetical protein
VDRLRTFRLKNRGLRCRESFLQQHGPKNDADERIPEGDLAPKCRIGLEAPGPLRDGVDERRPFRRGGDERVYLAGVVEQQPLEDHRFGEFGADFGVPPIEVGDVGRLPSRERLGDTRGGQVALDHRVIDPFGAEAIDESARITGDEHPGGAGPANRTADRNQEGCEVTPG